MRVEWSASKVKFGSKSENRELFVSIVELKDLSNFTESFIILISVDVKVVKGVSIGWFSITECEIDCNCQVKVTSTKDVFQKAVSLLELELFEGKFCILLFDYIKWNIWISFGFIAC